jgi:hypothetical protein
MYQIEYLGRMIWGNDLSDSILEPKLDEELNSAGTFTFTIPVENEWAWNNIQVFKGEIRIYEGDDIIWFGRPLQIVRNWKNQKVVTCEGALAYFNDSIQATHTYEKLPLYTHPDYQSGKKGFINTIVDLHNDQVHIAGEDTSRQIFIGTIDVDDENNIYREVDYNTTAECLQQMCLDTNGGYFILRKAVDPEDGNLKTYLDWRKEPPYGTTQKIVFGENLLDLNQDLNGADVCTVLLALGKDDKTVSGLNKYKEENPYVAPSGNEIYHTGEYIYHKQGYEKYGRVVKIKNWSDIISESQDGKEQLFIKAAEWLEDQNTEIVTIECSAADLHYIPDDDKRTEGKLRIGQMVTLMSSIHGLPEKRLPIYKISMDLGSGAKQITIGTPPKRELTDIVKSKGGSTRSSSGTTGGGGTGSGGSSGGGDVNIPVKDVMIQEPGDEKYKTTVKKKTSKIDLSGYVKDITMDGGDSIVDRSTGTADIQVPVKGVTVNGDDVVNPETGVAEIEVQNLGVTDVTVDDLSIVDPETGIAEIDSSDFIKVRDVKLGGVSLLNSDKEANINVYTEQGFRTYNSNKIGYGSHFIRDLYLNKSICHYLTTNSDNYGRFINLNLKNGRNTRLRVGNVYTETGDVTFDSRDIFVDSISPTEADIFSLLYDVTSYEPDYTNPQAHAVAEKLEYTINNSGFYGIQMLALSAIGSVAFNFVSIEKTDTLAYTQITPVGDEDPKALGWYTYGEHFGNYCYIPASTNYVVSGTDYYTLNNPPLVYKYIHNDSNHSYWFFNLIYLEVGDKVIFRWYRDEDAGDGQILRNIFKINNFNTSTINVLRDNSLIDYQSLQNVYTTNYGSKMILAIQSFLDIPNESSSVKGISTSDQFIAFPQSGTSKTISPYVTLGIHDNEESEILPSQITNGILFAIDNNPQLYNSVSLYQNFNKLDTLTPNDFVASIIVIEFPYQESSGGTTVIANPSAPASYDLSKVQIGNDVYGVATPTDIATLQSNFQDGVDAIYDACVAKGSTPASQSLSDVVQGIMDIPQGGGATDTIQFYSNILSYQLNEVTVDVTYDTTGLTFISEVTIQ